MPRAYAPFVIRRVHNPQDLDHVHDLDRICFPRESEVRLAHTQWWLVRTGGAGAPVAYAGMKLVDKGTGAFLSRVGVAPWARGHGLQRRLIRARVQAARDQGCRKVVTYVAWDNLKSTNNLVSEGFLFYNPEWAWVGRDGQFLYLIKELK
jgi:GNAT superfamily N-acetyltransferase